MAARSNSTWKRFRNNVRNRMVSGMLVLVPVGVTLLVMRWVLGWMAGFLQPHLRVAVDRLEAALHLEHVPPAALEIAITVISVLGFLAVVYLAGGLAKDVIGRRLIAAAESILMRVPLARSIYSAAKQVVEAVAMPTQANLRTVVLLEFPRRESWSVGFMTGRVADSGPQDMLKVFVPTTPNPTTGFFIMLPFQQVTMTDLTVEEAFKVIMSGGIVSPAALGERLMVAQAKASAAGGSDGQGAQDAGK